MTFEVQPAARVIAQLSDNNNTISITGVDQNTTPSNAQTQINKLTAIWGARVLQSGMKIIKTSIASDS